MKLGLAYNVFDGEELLGYSISQIRELVDFVAIVYQTTSNYGNKNPQLLDTLNKLKAEGLIDMLFEFEPTFEYDSDNKIKILNGTPNELEKRNIGLKICKANGCDTFMTMDCDELYKKEEFKKAKEEFERGGYDTSFCKMEHYYKLPTMQLYPPQEYYCPLFYKIKKDTLFTKDLWWDKTYPVHIDRTRRIVAGYPRIFTREEIQMHHFAYVRKDLSIKIQNTSAQMDKGSQKEILYHYNSWKGKESGALLLSEQRYRLKEVDNYFNIEL
jgi:hypothetical protein